MKTEPAPSGGRACLHCGGPIPPEAHGNARYCDASCRHKAYRERDPERAAAVTKRWREAHPEKRNELKRGYMRRLRLSDIRRSMLSAAKSRAKQQGVPFNLTLDDLGPLPEVCPVLGIPIEIGEGTHVPGSPSLDKIIPALGYVPGNVIIVSHRANALKRDATVAEMQALASFYSNLVSSGGWMVPHTGKARA